jgi:NitT/TauT family transport system substrate-binding protein
MARMATLSVIMLALSPISACPVFAQVERPSVKIQDYPGIGNMLFRVAASKGFCKKYGLTCELQMIPSGPLGAQALLAKSIDVGFFPVEVQINAMIKGANLKAILSGARLNPFEIVVRNDLDVPHAGKGFPEFMTDLKGRKIGVPVDQAQSSNLGCSRRRLVLRRRISRSSLSALRIHPMAR